MSKQPEVKTAVSRPCPDCTRLERKLDAFVMFLCEPHPKCQCCGLLATKMTTVVHPVMGRSEHLCCDECKPAQAKIPGSVLESKTLEGADRAVASNAIICEARRGS